MIDGLFPQLFSHKCKRDKHDTIDTILALFTVCCTYCHEINWFFRNGKLMKSPAGFLSFKRNLLLHWLALTFHYIRSRQRSFIAYFGVYVNDTKSWIKIAAFTGWQRSNQKVKLTRIQSWKLRESGFFLGNFSVEFFF